MTTTDHPVAAARQRVDDQINRLHAVADHSDAKGLAKECAILNALSARESEEFTNHAASELVRNLGVFDRTITERATELIGAIDAFTKAATDSSNDLTTWTRRMAFASWALVFFAVVQIAVAVLGWFFAAPQIIVVPR
jgi:hypothetical protein